MLINIRIEVFDAKLLELIIILKHTYIYYYNKLIIIMLNAKAAIKRFNNTYT